MKALLRRPILALGWWEFSPYFLTVYGFGKHLGQSAWVGYQK
jgi:hypothetical protein